MRTPLTSISAGGLTLMTLSTLSLAQGAPPPSLSADPPAPQAAVYDPQQLPAIPGELDRLTLTARGDIDGFILKDGMEVKTAPESDGEKLFRMLRCGSMHRYPSIVLDEIGNGIRNRTWPVLALRISRAEDAGLASASTMPTSPFPLAVQSLVRRPSER